VRAVTPGFYAYILSKGGGPTAATNASYAFYTGGTGGLYFYVTATGNQSYLSPTPVNAAIWDGAWHHIAGTYDGSVVRLFVDGTEVGTGTAAVAAINYATPSGNLAIGALHPTVPLSYNFNGDIDEVRVWNRVLTQAEIQARANRGSFTGSWSGMYSFGNMSATLTQSGSGVSGTVTDSTGCTYTVSGTASGSTLSLPTWSVCPGTVTLTGTASADWDTISGSGNTNGIPWTFSWTRQ
jgi:hypothetical protein